MIAKACFIALCYYVISYPPSVSIGTDCSVVSIATAKYRQELMIKDTLGGAANLKEDCSLSAHQKASFWRHRHECCLSALSEEW